MKKLLFLITLLLLPLKSYAVEMQEFTLEDKIGQMIMIGFRGMEVNQDSKILQDISSGKVGGVIYFDYDIENKEYDRNIKSPEQLQKLSHDLQKANGKLPIFIAVDQEGGKVQRLKPIYGFRAMMSAEQLGEIDNPDVTKWEATKTASILQNMGININFAPVVDVNVNPKNPAIGAIGRAFSSDPEKVYEQAKATIGGYAEKGILTSLKHFPGHGSTFNDSHLGLTDITETWDKKELIPYQKLIEDKSADLIMIGHLFNKNIDDTYPASISKKYTDMLRNDLDYEGVIITDDMQMKAISDFYTLEEQVDLFLESSADIILYGNNLEYDENIADKIFVLMQEAAKEDPIIEKRIDNSFERILKLKSRL